MKTTYKIVLGLILLAFIGCGGGDATTPTNATEENLPKAPLLKNKEKVPPSIPAI